MILALLHRPLPLPRIQKTLHLSAMDQHGSVAPVTSGLKTDRAATEDEGLWDGP